jgi:regulatory protein SWI6
MPWIKKNKILTCTFFLLALHNQVVEMEDQYQEQLRQRDIKSFQTKKEMNMLRYQLNEAQRRLELPVSMQLAEAQKRIHELEQLRVQSNSRTAAAICDDFVISNNTDSKSTTILEENNNLLDEDQPPPQPQAQTQSSKERKLEKKVKSLQNQLDAHSKTIDRLKSDLETTQQKAKQKEMEYRRLIAASCNLPIEKVDGLIGPLTLAIESDPPDLDMARVIGFMERLRRQNSTTSSSVNSPHNGSSSSGGGNNDTATTPV